MGITEHTPRLVQEAETPHSFPQIQMVVTPSADPSPDPVSDPAIEERSTITDIPRTTQEDSTLQSHVPPSSILAAPVEPKLGPISLPVAVTDPDNDQSVRPIASISPNLPSKISPTSPLPSQRQGHHRVTSQFELSSPRLFTSPPSRKSTEQIPNQPIPDLGGEDEATT